MDTIFTNRTMKPIISLLGVGVGDAATPRTFFSGSSCLGVSCFNRHSPKKAILRRSSSEIRIPARDRVIDFGKHKGKMLGTVSSEYLRWMSKNLNTGDWGKLAEDVLQDEVYADRMEWEVAEALLSGNREAVVLSGCGVARELEEISKRFGWDYHDKAGWSKVDFGLLGTSKACRLPRKKGEGEEEQKESNFNKRISGSGGVREKRRERAARKREQQIGVRCNEEEVDDDKNYNESKHEEGSRCRFPGREYLIRT